MSPLSIGSQLSITESQHLTPCVTGPAHSEVYQTPASPRAVLDKLELRGWKLLTVTGAGQTIIWTLHQAL